MSYRLPDGTVSEDVDAYVDAWVDIGVRLENALGDGWFVNGFNPGLVADKRVDNDDGTYKSIDYVRVSVSLAKRIIWLFERCDDDTDAKRATGAGR